MEKAVGVSHTQTVSCFPRAAHTYGAMDVSCDYFGSLRVTSQELSCLFLSLPFKFSTKPVQSLCEQAALHSCQILSTRSSFFSCCLLPWKCGFFGFILRAQWSFPVPIRCSSRAATNLHLTKVWALSWSCKIPLTTFHPHGSLPSPFSLFPFSLYSASLLSNSEWPANLLSVSTLTLISITASPFLPSSPKGDKLFCHHVTTLMLSTLYRHTSSHAIVLPIYHPSLFIPSWAGHTLNTLTHICPPHSQQTTNFRVGPNLGLISLYSVWG